MVNASDEGWALFRAQPELLAAAVWREAAKHYPDIHTQREFVNAYIEARRKADERRRDDQE